MASIPELRRYIRFQLSELGTQNKHHEFEHLARDFARQRICENILPATGPVSAGGDQGRDFETYRTYIASTPIANSTFVARASKKNLAFACSLQKDIDGKIKGDVSTICDGGLRPDLIYYFCESNLPVGRRHTLQAWCKESFGVELEIFDGQALAENLASLDICWIAQQYLHIPAEMFPARPEAPDWYVEAKAKWLSANQSPHNWADFFEIKSGLREATFNEQSRPDLVAWQQKMREILSDKPPPNLCRRVWYELAVTSLRGQNNLTSERPSIESFFAGLNTDLTPAELEDALVLLSYCSSAKRYGRFDIEVQKLTEWSRTLIDILDRKLSGNFGKAARCTFLDLRGNACVLPFRDGPEPSLDHESMFEWWGALLSDVASVPLFPLDRFADRLTVLTPALGEEPEFIDLTQQVDELLEARTGGFAAAEKCRDRALAYYKNHKFLLALKQFHSAKIHWFAAETIRGSLLSMLLLGRCYRHLGLIYAAQYYLTCSPVCPRL